MLMPYIYMQSDLCFDQQRSIDKLHLVGKLRDSILITRSYHCRSWSVHAAHTWTHMHSPVTKAVRADYHSGLSTAIGFYTITNLVHTWYTVARTQSRLRGIIPLLLFLDMNESHLSLHYSNQNLNSSERESTGECHWLLGYANGLTSSLRSSLLTHTHTQYECHRQSCPHDKRDSEPIQKGLHRGKPHHPPPLLHLPTNPQQTYKQELVFLLV